MKQLISITFLLGLLMPSRTNAQELPQAIVTYYTSFLKEKGEVLERAIVPNMTRTHPNDMLIDMPCFPGKKIGVKVLMAAKPGDLLLKVNVGPRAFTPRVEMREHTLSAGSFWLQGLSIDMSNLTNRSEDCMQVVAYDRSNIDLPIYIFVTSFK